MKIQKVCKICGTTVVFDMSREAYDMWKSGARIQEVAPELTADQREILISGICGTCFDNMFSEEEELSYQGECAHPKE